MFNYIKTTFLYTLFIPFYLLAQEAPLQLSLEDAIEIVKTKGFENKVARYNTNLAEYQLKESRANYLPRLQLTGNYNRNIDRQVIFFPDATGAVSAIELGADNDYSTTLNLSVPLFSKSNAGNKKTATANLALQQEAQRGTQLTTLATVKKGYYAYLISLEAVNVQELALKNALENQQLIEKRLTQGTVTDFDLTSAMVQVATVKNNLLETQNNTVPAANFLRSLLDIPTTQDIELTDVLLQDLYDPISAQDSNEQLAQNSDLQQQKLQEEVSELNVAFAKTAFYPTLDFIGNYQYQAQADDFDLGDYDWVNTSLVGLRLNYTLFNGTVTKQKVAQAEISRQIAHEQTYFVTQENERKLAESIAQLRFAQDRITVQNENVTLAQEALIQIKKRYEFGRGTYIEVNDAELNYTQAQLQLLQAIFDYKSAFFDYELLIGKDN